MALKTLEMYLGLYDSDKQRLCKDKLGLEKSSSIRFLISAAADGVCFSFLN